MNLVRIDETYFHGKLYVPVEAGNAGIAAELTEGNVYTLKGAIAKYSEEYLERMLGVRLYDDLQIGLGQDPVDPKWVALQDKLVDTRGKTSPIANYVYVNYLRDNEVYLGHRANAMVPSSDNQHKVSNYRLIKSAHDEGVRKNIELAQWLWDRKDEYDPSDTAEFVVYSSGYGFPAKAGFPFSLFRKETYGI